MMPHALKRSIDIVTLTRSRITFIALSLTLLMVAIVAIVAGTIVAQGKTSLKDALESKDGDETVVATVDGADVTRGNIRHAVEFKMAIDSSLTSEDARSQIIVQVIDRAIAEAEIDRRQITVADKEAEEYMHRNRDLCRGDNGGQCRDAIEQLGFDISDDSYWSAIALPEYKRMIAETKLFHAIIEEKSLQDADNDTLVAMQQALPGILRTDAVIVWHDDDLKQTYQQALPSE